MEAWPTMSEACRGGAAVFGARTGTVCLVRGGGVCDGAVHGLVSRRMTGSPEDMKEVTSGSPMTLFSCRLFHVMEKKDGSEAGPGRRRGAGGPERRRGAALSGSAPSRPRPPAARCRRRAWTGAGLGLALWRIAVAAKKTAGRGATVSVDRLRAGPTPRLADADRSSGG